MIAMATSAGVILILAGVFIIAAIGALMLRGKAKATTQIDIPRAMRPGPSDPALETPLLQKLQGWSVVLVAFFVVWIPWVWLREGSNNLQQEKALKTAAIDRGQRATQLNSEENPLGVGCVRCHGPQLTGGVIKSGDAYAYPPNLTTICGGNLVNPPHAAIASIDDIYQVIQQGRNAMPSWSIRYAGALDDQQINDLVNYLVWMSSQHVPYADNVCTNPAAVKKALAVATAAGTVLERP